MGCLARACAFTVITLTYGTSGFAGGLAPDVVPNAIGQTAGTVEAPRHAPEDVLANCLVKSTSADDRIALIKWVFVAMSSHPAVAPYAKFTTEDIAEIDKNAGALFQRLLTVDCRSEVVAALKHNGASSLGSGFNILGQVAMRGLMTDPNVGKSLGSLRAAIDEDKIRELYKEAGVSTQSAPEAEK